MCIFFSRTGQFLIQPEGGKWRGEQKVIYYHLSCPDTGSRGLHTSHPVSGHACGPQVDVTDPQIYYLTRLLVVFSIIIQAVFN